MTPCHRHTPHMNGHYQHINDVFFSALLRCIAWVCCPAGISTQLDIGSKALSNWKSFYTFKKQKQIFIEIINHAHANSSNHRVKPMCPMMYNHQSAHKDRMFD